MTIQSEDREQIDLLLRQTALALSNWSIWSALIGGSTLTPVDENHQVIANRLELEGKIHPLARALLKRTHWMFVPEDSAARGIDSVLAFMIQSQCRWIFS